MAAPLRIPWRIISRQMSANPIISSNQLLRSRASNPPSIPASCRYESTTAHTPPPEPIPEGTATLTPALIPALVPEGNAPVTTEAKAEETPQDEDFVRLPRAVQAAYLRPLRREAIYHVPSCDLQLRSYTVRNLEFFADFCMRAAYFCGLPAYGPVPLPQIRETWTVPRGPFIHKKSQENFRRTTLRRLIQIKDGHPETVEIWLAFIQKHQYYGIGMKANVWNYEKIGLGKTMDANALEMKQQLDERWDRLAVRKGDTMQRAMELINKGGRESANAPPTGKLPASGGGRGLGWGPSMPRGSESYGKEMDAIVAQLIKQDGKD